LNRLAATTHWTLYVQATQCEAFERVLNAIQEAGIALPPRIHLANSAASLRGTALTDLTTMSRSGIAIYGCPADAETDSFGEKIEHGLLPVMSLKATVSYVAHLDEGDAVSYGLRRPLQKPSLVATLPLGYADGVCRGLWKEGAVLIDGKRRPFAGVICMDSLAVDCGDDEVSLGAEAVLLGTQCGDSISANEWGRLMGTIGYEILCGITPRVGRVYLQ